MGSTILPSINNRHITRLPIAMRSSTSKAGEGDNGFISGIVTEGGNPVARRVFCYYRKTGELIRTVRSNEQGVYRIDGLRPNSIYYLTSIDNNGDDIQYNAVTQDLIAASEVTL